MNKKMECKEGCIWTNFSDKKKLYEPLKISSPQIKKKKI